MSPQGTGSLLARTARGAGWIMAWRLGMRVLGLVSTLVLVRLLAPADFGLIALATGFMQTIDGMMLLGIEEAMIRENRPGRDTYDTAFTLNLLRGLAATLIVGGCAIPAGAFFGDPRLGPVLLFIACLPLLDGLSNIGPVDFRRDLDFSKEFAMMVLPKLGGIIAAIAAAIILRSYVAMLFGIGVNRTLRVVMSYVMHPYRPRLSLKDWRGLASYSAWSWLLSLAFLVRDRCDTLLLGRMLGPGQLGLWSVGAEVAALPTTELVEPLGRAAFSGFAAARRQELAAGAMYLRVIGGAALLTIPAAAGLSLMAGPLVRAALGPGWEATVPVLQVLAIAGAVSVLGHMSLNLMSAHALLGRLVGSALTGAACRVVLILLLAPGFGLAGAAWAVGASVVAEQALTVAIALRRFGVRPAALAVALWRPAAAAAAMCAAVWALGHGWLAAPGTAAEAWRLLASGATVGSVVYAAVLLSLWAAAGRPDGPEADLLGFARRAFGR